VIEKENFERAAELRDEIYTLEKKIGSEWICSMIKMYHWVIG
jgi:hypothetical protein